MATAFLESIIRAAETQTTATTEALRALWSEVTVLQAGLTQVQADIALLKRPAPSVLPDLAFFDDFAYRSVGDPAFATQGWRVVDGVSGPAPVPGAVYTKDLVTCADDPGQPGNRLLHLGLTVSSGEVRQCRIETGVATFLRGTWAARVYFNPLSGTTADRYQDAPVEAFWGYRPGGEALSTFSEIDIGERLPRNVWGRGAVGEGALWFTSWGQNAPTAKIYQSTALVGRFPGWHVLSAQVAPGTPPASVTFFLDGQQQSRVFPPAAPDAPMNLSLGHWLAARGTPPAGSPDHRGYRLAVDWVLYAQDQLLTTTQVLALVEGYRHRGVVRLNTVS